MFWMITIDYFSISVVSFFFFYFLEPFLFVLCLHKNRRSTFIKTEGLGHVDISYSVSQGTNKVQSATKFHKALDVSFQVPKIIEKQGGGIIFKESPSLSAAPNEN